MSANTVYEFVSMLPPEILRYVFKELQDQSTSEHSYFTTAFRVCPDWREVGESLVWTDICLTRRRLSRFVAINNGRHASTLSLTIIIDPVHCEHPNTQVFKHSYLKIHTESRATAKLWEALRALPWQLRKMRTLSSFSLRVTGCPYGGPPDGFWLRNSDVCSIVASLPPTVAYLEVDSYCLDRFDRAISATKGLWKKRGTHLCQLLQSMLPDLTSLRLRFSSLCTDIIPDAEDTDTDQSPLAADYSPADVATSHILINTVDFEDRASTQNCHVSFDRNGDPLEDESGCQNLVKELFDKSDGTWKKGNGQDLRPVNLSVVELYGGMLHSEEMDERSFSAITKSTLHPSKAVQHLYKKLGSDPNHYFLRHKNVHGQDTESCGFQNDLLDVVEGHAWVETVQGYRFSSPYFHQERRFDHVKLKASPLWSQNDYVTTTTLWRMEQSEGRMLLRAQESDDLNDIGWVQRDKTSAEIEEEAQAWE